MGIRDRIQQVPGFETQDQEEGMTTTIDAPAAAVTSTPTEATVQAPAVIAATTAVAKAATTKFKMAFADKLNAIDIDMVSALSLSSPRIKGEQGAFFVGTDELGAKIHFQLESWNKRWAIGTGDDTKESKEKFRVSYDGINLSDGTGTVKDYIDQLRQEGHTKAGSSVYFDLWGMIVWTDSKGAISIEQAPLSLLQCAPTSAGAFTNFCMTRGMIESRGLAQPLEVIEVRAMKRVKGDNKFTNFEFFAPVAK